MAPAADAAILLAETAGHRTLADVLAWALGRRPALVLAEVIVQDEYTHDVVLAAPGGIHLVYDTT